LVVATSLIGFVPVVVGVPRGVELAVLDNGVRMPAIETPAPPAELEEVVPPPPPPPPPKPPVPVYPKKQARH